MRIAVWAGVLFTLSVGVGACTASAAQDDREDANVSSRTSGAEGASGAASYGSAILPWEQRRFVVIAEQTLVARCMERAGLLYEVVEPPSTPPAGDGAGNPYGSDDVETLQARGYGLGEEQSDQPSDPNAVHVQSLPANERSRYTRTLFGDDSTSRSIDLPGGMSIAFNTDGCLAHARDALFGDQLEYARLFFAVENSAGEVTDRVYQDPRYEEALSGWRDCMSRQGFDVESPGHARDLAARWFDTLSSDEARRRELEIATADGSCARDAGLVRAGLRLAEEHLADLLEERESQVLAYREMQVLAVERAKGLLDD